MEEWTKEFGERIRYLRKRLAGMTQRQLAAHLGLDSPDSVTRLERGTSNRVNLGILRGLVELARVHHHDSNWLIEGEAPSSETQWPTPQDLAAASHDDLMKEFSRLTVESLVVSDLIKTRNDPAARARLLEGLSSPDRKRVVKPAAPPSPPVPGYKTVEPEMVTGRHWQEHYVPVIGRIAAGTGIDTVEATEYPPGWAAEFLVYDGAPDTSVALRIKGDSMAPDYLSGDMVVVDPAVQEEFDVVCCVLVRVDHIVEARLKRPRLTDDGRVRLESLNSDPQYAAEIVPCDTVIRQFAIVDHLPLIRRG